MLLVVDDWLTNCVDELPTACAFVLFVLFLSTSSLAVLLHSSPVSGTPGASVLGKLDSIPMEETMPVAVISVPVVVCVTKVVLMTAPARRISIQVVMFVVRSYLTPSSWNLMFLCRFGMFDPWNLWLFGM